MQGSTEDRIYFVTRGLIEGRVKIYSKEHIVWSYGTALFGLGIIFSYILLSNSQNFGFGIVALTIILASLYFSFVGGRREAKTYIEEHRSELATKGSNSLK